MDSISMGGRVEECLARLDKSPLTEKGLRQKQERIYNISPTKELFYLADVRELHSWLIILNHHRDLSSLIPCQKLQREFLGDFLPYYIKYLMYCKQFRQVEMMVLFQDILREALNFFVKYFHLLQTYPQMFNILKVSLDADKQFYKVNHQDNRTHIIPPLTQEREQKIRVFVGNLKEGDRVDALKAEGARRFIWSPAVVTSVTEQHISFVHEGDTSFEEKEKKSSFKVFPFQTFTKGFEWRGQLKTGDHIDYEFKECLWKKVEIKAVEEVKEDETTFNMVLIEETPDRSTWVPASSPLVLPAGTFSSPTIDVEEEIRLRESLIVRIPDDYNDILLEGKVFTECAILRKEISSTFFIQLMNHFSSIGGLSLLLSQANNPTTHLDVLVQLVGFVAAVSPVFHRRFAVEFVPQFVNAATHSLLLCNEFNIRIFTKEKFSLLMEGLVLLMKRYLSTRQRMDRVCQTTMAIIKLFIDSDVLERKFNGLSILTDLVKDSRMDQELKIDAKTIEEWIVDNNIIHKIYKENSHPELISRSSELLKLYLSGNPPIPILEALLEDVSQPMVKVMAETISDIPLPFLNKVAQKLSEDSKTVVNGDVIAILKAVGGYELWSLQRGGEGWVDLVTDKKSRRQDLMQLFGQSLDVVCKVFTLMSTKDPKLSRLFITLCHNEGFIEKLIHSDVDSRQKLEFLKHFFGELQDVDNSSLELIRDLWDETYQLEGNKCFLETFRNIIGIASIEQLLVLSDTCFTTQKLRLMPLPSFLIFKKIVSQINGSKEDFLSEALPYGLDMIMEVLFENPKLQVTKKALQFIFVIINSLEESGQKAALKENLLKKCLQKVYQTSDFEKDLSILQGIINESEREGNGSLDSLAKQLPPITLTYTVLNHFYLSNKTKFTVSCQSNITLFEFRHEIASHINAHYHEIRLISNGNTVEESWNGLTLQEIDLRGAVAVVRKTKIKRAELTKANKLTIQAERIFQNIFSLYSSAGQMSKEDCRRLLKKMTGDSVFMTNSKVDKVFENYDTDKDDLLTLENFVAYFENACYNKPNVVWSGLEALGVREDLRIIDSAKPVQPSPESLPRYFLIRDTKFMALLFGLINDGSKSAEAAWKILFRLPVYLNAPIDSSSSPEYHLRYWLYIQDHLHNSDVGDTLGRILESSRETMVIGLKVAEGSDIQLTFSQLQLLSQSLEAYNKQESVDMLDMVILGFSLKMICKGLDFETEERGSKETSIEELFLQGVLSQNPTIRKEYLKGIGGMLPSFINTQPQLFQRLFKVLQEALEQELTSLTPEYFQLFSNLLVVSSNNQFFRQEASCVLDKVLVAFKEWESRETSLVSAEDTILIGFMKLIRGLSTLGIYRENTVRLLFSQCLFPSPTSQGSHQLKSYQSRKEAYNLIISLCKLIPEAVLQLLDSNFQEIYLKAGNVRDSYYSPKARSTSGSAGIQNLGCICYMIAMIQQFFMVRPFRYLLLMADDKQPEELVRIQQPEESYFFSMFNTKKEAKMVDDNVLHQFQLLFAKLELTEKQDIDPQDFCSTYKDYEGNPVNVMVQQDSQEFLNMLFEKFETSLKNTPFRNIVTDTFGGKYCSQLMCSSCKKVSNTFQNFFSLSLEVKEKKSIFESLSKFIEGEVVPEYKCEGCGKKADTTKRCYISQLPNYLILHLQRIGFNYTTFENQKVNSRLEFTHDLNIQPYTFQHHHQSQGSPLLPEDHEYKLKGVVVHIGTADYGHYFSYIQGESGQWLEYNDDNVMEFDVADLEEEAFGGSTGWRKDHQNAYLLLYEKTKKSPVKLEFCSTVEKEKVMAELKLKEVALEQVRVEAPKEQGRMEEEMAHSHEETGKDNEEEIMQEAKAAKPLESPPPPRIDVFIQPSSINPYVRPQHKQLIAKQNQEFTINIHTKSPEFVDFLYNVAMLETPPQFKNALLGLCSQSFSGQSLGNGVVLSDVLSRRFTELIEHSGWDFFNSKKREWVVKIFSMEPEVRRSIKHTMVPTLSDMIRHSEGKQEHLAEFLVEFWGLTEKKVQDNWEESGEYFEIWYELLDIQETFVLLFLQGQKSVERLVPLALTQNYSPFTRRSRRINDSNNDQPLSLILKLLQKGYQINNHESQLMSSYQFLSKLVNQLTPQHNVIKLICTSNAIASERVAYLVLTNLTKITYSLQAKPLIQTTKQFLQIPDQLSPLRLEWLLGQAQFTEHQAQEESVGFYGLSAIDESVRLYYSPLGVSPLLETVFSLKDKYEHITILLITLLLELEKEGVVDLRLLPAVQPLFHDYTHWFGEYIGDYKPQSTEMYRQYETRVKHLWKERQQRHLPYDTVQYLVGKVVGEKVVTKTAESTQSPSKKNTKTVEITECEYVANICKAEYDEDGLLLHAASITHEENPFYFIFEEASFQLVQNSELYLKKAVRSLSAEEQGEVPNSQLQSPFRDSFECNFIRKVKATNLSSQEILVVMSLVFNEDNPNVNFPRSLIRFVLGPDEGIIFVMTKRIPEKEWPSYTFEWDQTVEKRTNFFLDSSQYPPRLLTLEVQQQSPMEQQSEGQMDEVQYLEVSNGNQGD